MTVHDVAELSGVSIATVSRTLRAPHRVSDATRTRVLKAVEQLGYRPNRAASSLRRGRTGAIALVVPDIENPYFASLTKGAQASSRARGYGLVVVDTTESAEIEAEEIRALGSQVDGMIIASSRLSDDALAEVAASTTCVLINRSLPDAATPTVTIDEASGARAAIGHLAGLGHRRIAYVGGPESSWSEGRRWSGLLTAASEHDGVSAVHVGSVTPDARGGHAAAAAALEHDATAVIAYNDLVALGMLARWAELGVRVPDDVSLVGFDNTFVAELSSPPLTSVGADLREFGETAVSLLLDRIDGSTPPPSPVPTTMDITVRGSTAAPAR
ncbi:DNA-binding LacI/PurR family transcriptional regulator [Microbacterium ulmi]|nr:DNA-binding LacI/PurR family transcriptional regulator [Microbacterium ulmi]